MKDIEYEIQNNEFVKLLLESIGDGIFVLDIHGTIIAWNPAMEKITGYSSDEVKGKSCEILKFNQCFDKDCPTGMKDCGILKYGKVQPTECLLSHKKGHTLSVTKNARVIKNKQNKVIGIVEAVTDLTELKNARLKMEEATRRLGELNRLGGIIAKSQVMQNVFTFIKASAASETTILIQGESGTGKELVAGAIHSIGERRDKPLIIINCSALSESLLESVLFGHIKGAFTGASQNRLGRFEQADGGTIFLDEIGEITPYIQVKLLRVIQQKEIERVGESRKRKIDIRIITATNKNLKSQVDKGHFREDLYYRLKVFPIYLPPLRNRKEDIPLLVNHFIKINNEKATLKVTGITKPTLRAFMDYSWPGNIRELANAIEHAFVLCSNRQIEPDDLPIEIREPDIISRPVEKENPYDNKKPTHYISPLTREKLIELLHDNEWNKAKVARRVGLSRASIWKYMKKWDIPLQP
ncbi:MAG: sigma 54-interacting transcriptional regulator [Desulfobacula sp.]|jgi:two-component system response regulator HydG|nr:sigma 54-interacting transcriptional regulator [Desulfobacula sp.]